ncbi:MAG: alginate O-acetyltransferase AlgX-related protein [Spartobacteria bacterium]
MISFEALMFFSRAVSKFSALFLLLAATCVATVRAAESTVPAASEDQKKNFRDGLTGILEKPHEGISIPGRNGWIFFDKELRHLAAPRFWSEPTPTTPETTDPLPAILDFKAQLDAAGFDLLLVPVPAKAAIYPDQLLPEFPAPPSTPAGLAEHDAEFVKVLEAQGVKVLDLTEDFLKVRAEGLDTHCRTDTHWSPEGIRLAAQKIATTVSAAPWTKDQPRLATQSQNSILQIRGDLAPPEAPAETLPARTVTESGVSGSTGIPDARNSPVVLLGDSHNLVFHTGGEMHATGAGLPDQLCHELGFPMDVVAVMGSGSTAARRSLARRKDNLAGKKLDIWCFSTREFTQGQGWANIQTIKPPAEQTP